MFWGSRRTPQGLTAKGKLRKAKAEPADPDARSAGPGPGREKPASEGGGHAPESCEGRGQVDTAGRGPRHRPPPPTRRAVQSAWREPGAPPSQTRLSQPRLSPPLGPPPQPQTRAPRDAVLLPLGMSTAAWPGPWGQRRVTTGKQKGRSIPGDVDSGGTACPFPPAPAGPLSPRLSPWPPLKHQPPDSEHQAPANPGRRACFARRGPVCRLRPQRVVPARTGHRGTPRSLSLRTR